MDLPGPMPATRSSNQVPSDLRDWLTGAGIGVQGSLTALQRGLGANEIWKLEPGAGESPLVVRLFGPGKQVPADREAAAMRAARANGVPVPEIVASGAVGDRPVLVTSFVPGHLAADAIFANPANAAELGAALGHTLGQIHLIPAPDLGRPPDAWLDLGGDAIAPLRPLLATVPDGDRLLHLDYHPRNVLVEGTIVTGVIDWENTHAGPPHADLARTLAILHTMQLANLVPPEAAPVIETFSTSLVTAHDTVVGPSPLPGALTAWGLAMTAQDLAHQAGKPGNPMTEEVLARLFAARDTAITTALQS